MWMRAGIIETIEITFLSMEPTPHLLLEWGWHWLVVSYIARSGALVGWLLAIQPANHPEHTVFADVRSDPAKA